MSPSTSYINRPYFTVLLSTFLHLIYKDVTSGFVKCLVDGKCTYYISYICFFCQPSNIFMKEKEVSFPAPDPEAVAMLMPKKNGLPFMNSLLRRERWWPRRMLRGLTTLSWQIRMCLIHGMKAMQSLKSGGYVKEQLAWRHFYWYSTKEGIQCLCDYLHLPPEIMPATLHRSCPETDKPRPKGVEAERPARLTRGEADGDTYRRSAVHPGANKKAKAGAGSATEFQFRGRFGRGCGQPPQESWSD